MAATLGQTRDPRALIPGDSAALRAYAASLTSQGASMTRVGDGLTGLDRLETWSGPSAEAFRGRFEPYPGRWLAGGEAHQVAASAVSRYAGTLEWAQSQAAVAVQRWDQAQAVTDAAVTAYNQAAARGARQAPFADPGAAARDNAQALLTRARDQLARSGTVEARAVTAAASGAAVRPQLSESLGATLESDGADPVADTVNGVASWLNAAVRNPAALGEAVGGTALAAAGAVVTAASGVLDAGVVTSPAGAGTGVGGMAMMAGGVALAGDGLRAIASHAASDDQVSPVGGGALTMPFGKKQQPPQLTEEEKQALEDKAEGKPFDKDLFKSAKKKVATGEKFEGERNLQKRADTKKKK